MFSYLNVLSDVSIWDNIRDNMEFNFFVCFYCNRQYLLFVSTVIKTISCHYFMLEFSVKRYAQCFHVIFMKEGGIIWAPGSVDEISGPTFLSLPSGEGCWFRSRQEEITEWKLPVESHSNFTPLLSLFNSLKRCSLNY